MHMDNMTDDDFLNPPPPPPPPPLRRHLAERINIPVYINVNGVVTKSPNLVHRTAIDWNERDNNPRRILLYDAVTNTARWYKLINDTNQYNDVDQIAVIGINELQLCDPVTDHEKWQELIEDFTDINIMDPPAYQKYLKYKKKYLKLKLSSQ